MRHRVPSHFNWSLIKVDGRCGRWVFHATKFQVQVTDFSYPLSMYVTNCCSVCLSMFVVYRSKVCSFTQIVFAKQFFITVLTACLHVFNSNGNGNYNSDSVISPRKAYRTYIVISDQYVCQTQRTFRYTTNSYMFRHFNESIIRLYRNERKMSLICHNSVTTQNLWFFRRNVLKVLKCYNFLWVQRRHNCSPAASFANCVLTLYLLKVHLQTFLSVPII